MIQEEKVDQLMIKVSEQESAAVAQQASFRLEIDGVKKMADLYKRYFGEATDRVEVLERAESVLRENMTAQQGLWRSKWEREEQRMEAERGK